MHRLLVSALLAVLFASPAFAQTAPRFTPDELKQGYSHRRILAKPRASISAADLQRLESSQQLRASRRFPRFGNLSILETPANTHPLAFVEKLRASGRYDYVEFDHIKKRHSVPNDPKFTSGEQWHLRNTGQLGGTPGADIGAVSAWDIRSSAADIIVAVIDTGIRATHEDLAANLWINPGEIPGNNLDDDANGYIDDVNGINAIATTPATRGNPADDSGHGTSVASAIAAAGNNAKGLAGVAWSAKIMSLKFDDANDAGSLSAEIACIDYAIAKGAKIINLSYGSSFASQSEFDAITRARNAGIIFVVSAGNDGTNNDLSANYPSNFIVDNLVAVANSTRTDTLSSASSYGPGLVELAAPGTDIATASYQGDNQYRTVSGTSFSAPITAGALALLKAQFPSDTYRQTINRLLRSTTPLPSLQNKVQTAGRLNLAAALASTVNRPFNDDFSTRSRLSGETIIVRSCSASATTEPDEPTHAGLTPAATLWWSWTPSNSGPAIITTALSDFDTTLALYTGIAINALTPVASNDNDPTNLTATTSRLQLNVTAGTTYQIAVSGKTITGGLVRLAIGTVPANDNFANATVLTGATASVTGSNALATRESGEPVLTYSTSTGPKSATGSTVWYRWIAPATRRYAVSVSNAAFDPVVGIYIGTTLNALTRVTSDDYSVSFSATVGFTYYFAVDTETTDTGAFTLSLLPDCVTALPLFSDGSTSPVSTKDNFYLFSGANGLLYYFAATNNWFKFMPGSTDVSTPTIGPDNVVYAATDSGNLRAHTPTGDTKWNQKLPTGISSSPTLATDGTVYAHCDNGQLYAVTSAGAIKWQVAIPGSSYSSASISGDGIIYIGSTDGFLYALNPADGSTKWRFNTGGEIYASPAIGSDGAVYIGNLSGQFYCLNAAGTQRYLYSTGGQSISSSAALAPDGTAYFGCYDKNLHAVSTTGARKWIYATGDEIRASSPAIGVDGTIYIGSYDRHLHAVRPDGTLREKYATGGIIRSSPVIAADGELLFGSNDDFCYILTINQGPAASPWPMHRGNPQRTGQGTGQAAITPPPPPAPNGGGGGGGGGGAPSLFFLTALGALAIGRRISKKRFIGVSHSD